MVRTSAIKPGVLTSGDVLHLPEPVQKDIFSRQLRILFEEKPLLYKSAIS
jgi:hypothetical protein